MTESDADYNYFCDLVVKLQDDGKSPSDFIVLGARLIEHAYAGAHNQDEAAKWITTVLQRMTKNLGMEKQ